MRTILPLAIVLCLFSGCAPAPEAPRANAVVTFLGNAERQAETDEQRAEIQHALSDMLEKSPAELRQLRYRGYENGEAVESTLTGLLRRHFVPDPPAVLDEETFLRDLAARDARQVVRRQLDDIGRAIAENKPDEKKK